MPRVITRDQVKAQLGISDSTYDTAIDAKLPIIDAKVKAITRNNWNKRIIGNTVSGSALVEVSDYEARRTYPQHREYEYYYDYILDWVEVGQQVTGEGMPSGVYITDIWPDGTQTSDTWPQVELSDNATQTKDGADLFLGFPITYHDIVAKGVWYLIQGTSTNLPANPAQSKSMGPVSINYSNADSKIDQVSGMPAWFVKGLPVYHGGV